MQELLRKMFADYYNDRYRYLYSLCRDAALAEELTAETFLQAVRSVKMFRREAQPRTWLFSIARHCWCRWCRTKGRQPEIQLLTEFELSGEPLPESQTTRKELMERIEQLMEEEPPRTREILQLRIEGYSFREIAKRHQISENSARVIEHRARQKIREQLKKEGFDYE